MGEVATISSDYVDHQIIKFSSAVSLRLLEHRTLGLKYTTHRFTPAEFSTARLADTLIVGHDYFARMDPLSPDIHGQCPHYVPALIAMRARAEPTSRISIDGRAAGRSHRGRANRTLSTQLPTSFWGSSIDGAMPFLTLVATPFP